MADSTNNLSAALEDWRALLGADNVVTGQACQSRYEQSTSGVQRRIPAALTISGDEHISEILHIARTHHVPVYPVSTGHNWGYGTANPVRDDCVILDMSAMNRISGFDAEMGVITVEPGVTQGQLRTFLDEQTVQYMVPVTGAGPSVSILGNALERGYGITPYTDHFMAVTAIEAVLPTGERYRSALRELGAQETDGAFKWGIGPYIDGLFAQGNFGIVTRMTLLLARKPERVTAFFFRVKKEQNLEAVVAAVRETLADAEANIGGINLMNAERMLSMMAPWPASHSAAEGALPDTLVAGMAGDRSITPWNGVGAIYSTKGIGRAVQRHVRAQLRPYVSGLVFVNRRRARLAQRLVRLAPAVLSRRLEPLVQALNSSLDIFSGRPAEIALQLPYWKSPQRMPGDGGLDPARDGCGLIWYAPLVPMKADAVRTFEQMVRTVCRAHGLEPLITLTSQSPRCFDATVPLLFQLDDPDQTARARACYNALFHAGQKHGFLPYRTSVDSMPLAVDDDAVFWQFARRLKQAADPDWILAPGRYSL